MSSKTHEEVRETMQVLRDLGLKIDEGRLLELLEEWRRADEEARRIRRESADWKFIEKQPEPIKTALKLLVETGDLKMVSKLFNISLGELNNLRLKAKVPLVLS